MNTTTLPLEWLKEVPTALLHLDDIPLLGFPPVFPWVEFSEKLKEHLQVKSLEVKPLNIQWRNSSDLFSGLGQDLIPIHFQIPSLEGDLCFLFAKRDLHLLMSHLLANSEEPLDIIDKEFENSFLQFLTYEAIYTFNECNFDKSLNPHAAENKENSSDELKEMLLKRENSLSQDISFSIDRSTFIFRLIISNEFRKSWKEKYAARSLEIPLNGTLAQKIYIPVALEAGRVSLKLSLWKELKEGDFLMLDSCSLDPESEKRRIMLTVNGNHFFRARLKQGNIKILEHPLFYEGQKIEENAQLPNEAKKTMTSTPSNDTHKEDHSSSDFDDDFTFSDHQDESEVSSHQTTRNAQETTEVDEKEEESDTEDQNLAAPLSPVKSKFNPEEMVLDIIVEVGRLEMSIQKLTELQPGNILEIDVRPENGVDLVVNGKRIGKGELLKLGEVLGVRILDI